MNTHYSIDLKRKLCQDICLNGKSTLQTANEFGIPLKTLEKWITAFNKNNHCFDDKIQNVDFKLADSFDENISYDDMSIDDLRKFLMKKDIEIARLKKGYLVKGDGTEEKVFVTFFKKNMK